ncbi:restriction endonuclease subunit S [Bacteroides fragilis]|uniref:restriction endonuclease subunit S n=3 Tax=Bacteroides fragilis TaxID=817 RepID=UPI00044F0421|nr:restriction endonuclease subunit S [Bacteroides fragilis]EYB06038.1 type I restriction modification DNA specificity domain protein [Bacteroides fragilis str. S6R5]EYE61005.1 type I restriction modification DNA specificity domain protein [Bacteroides fragilis str. S6R8]RGM81709.1 restriction endonuclease subunit S [Bacteroides fragilis]
MANNNENKILNVPNLRFPEFCGEWETIKVSELLDFYSTNSLSWEQLDYSNGKIKNLHYGLIHKGVPTMVDVACDSLPYIKEESMLKSFTLFKEGDVAFADASEDTNDVAKAIEVVNCDNQQIVSGLHTIHGRDNSNRTVIGYKGYAFASDSFHKQIRRIAQGTKVFSISVRNFDEAYIGIPSKEEQTQIAKLLITIDKRIATQNKIIDKLKSLIKGIDEVVFQSCSKHCKLKEFDNQITAGRDKVEEGCFPLYGSTGVIGTTATPSYHEPLVLVARVGSIGCVQFVNIPCGVSDNTIVIRCGSKAKYVYYYLQNYNFERITSGTTQPLITAKDVKHIDIPIIDSANDLKAINTLDTLNMKLELESNLYNTILKQKAFLLQQMFI